MQEVTGIAAAPYGALIAKAWRGLERETLELVDVTVREASARGEGIGVAIGEYSRAALRNGLGELRGSPDRRLPSHGGLTASSLRTTGV